jgi:hypothetical protein
VEIVLLELPHHAWHPPTPGMQRPPGITANVACNAPGATIVSLEPEKSQAELLRKLAVRSIVSVACVATRILCAPGCNGPHCVAMCCTSLGVQSDEHQLFHVDEARSRCAARQCHSHCAYTWLWHPLYGRRAVRAARYIAVCAGL